MIKNNYEVFNKFNGEIRNGLYVKGFEEEIENISNFIISKHEKISYNIA